MLEKPFSARKIIRWAEFELQSRKHRKRLVESFWNKKAQPSNDIVAIVGLLVYVSHITHD